MSTPVAFGVCGLGRIGAQHCRVFSRDRQQYLPVAFADIEADRAQALATELGGTAYSNIEAFLADPAMELAIIATRSLDHAWHAEMALAAGKIVLLEKPIGVTAADFELLKKLHQQYPKRLFFGHNHRFEPAFQNTLAILRQGLLGDVFLAKLRKHHQFMRRRDWQMRLDCGGGQLSVWGPHLIDQGLQLLGAPVLDVNSYLRRILTPGDADDHVKITLTGTNQRVVEIEISNSMAFDESYATVCGNRGALSFDQDQKEIRLKYLEPSFQWPEATSVACTPTRGFNFKADDQLPWVEETRLVEPQVNVWDYVEVEIARHLYQALRLNVPFPVKNEDALEVVRVTEIVKKQNPAFAWIG